MSFQRTGCCRTDRGNPLLAEVFPAGISWSGTGTNAYPADLNSRELFILGMMVIMIFWLGLYPRPVLTTSQQSISEVRQEREIPGVPEIQSEMSGQNIWYFQVDENLIQGE
jgi:hypothetical protein